jgi:hypothetical protein
MTGVDAEALSPPLCDLCETSATSAFDDLLTADGAEEDARSAKLRLWAEDDLASGLLFDDLVMGDSRFRKIEDLRDRRS